MPKAARGNQVDSVLSETGSGRNCESPQTTSTNECSPNTLINGTGAVREGDKIAPHSLPGCTPIDENVLDTFSSTVFINGKGAGRLGDQYTSDNTITSGSPNVFIGG